MFQEYQRQDWYEDYVKSGDKTCAPGIQEAQRKRLEDVARTECDTCDQPPLPFRAPGPAPQSDYEWAERGTGQHKANCQERQHRECTGRVFDHEEGGTPD